VIPGIILGATAVLAFWWAANRMAHAIEKLANAHNNLGISIENAVVTYQVAKSNERLSVERVAAADRKAREGK
jgi:hypothetical protein